jgi:hypothetical protein
MLLWGKQHTHTEIPAMPQHPAEQQPSLLAAAELADGDLEPVASGKIASGRTGEVLSIREAQRRGVYKPFDPLDHPGPPFWP